MTFMDNLTFQLKADTKSLLKLFEIWSTLGGTFQSLFLKKYIYIIDFICYHDNDMSK